MQNGKDITDAEIEEMADKCSCDGTQTVGALKVLQKEDMIKVYQMARG